MPDTDLAMAHEAARRNHDAKQKIEGLRHAARAIDNNLPVGKIARATAQACANRMREDAAALEARLA